MRISDWSSTCALPISMQLRKPGRCLQGETMCNTPTPLKYAQFYLDTWNEANASRRTRLLDEAWTLDAVYVDPLMQAEGRSQIAGLIHATQDRFPGWKFVLLGEPAQHRTEEHKSELPTPMRSPYPAFCM